METYYVRVDYTPAPEKLVLETFKEWNEFFSDGFNISVIEPGVFSISSNRIMDIYAAGMIGGIFAKLYPEQCEQPADAQQEQALDNAQP